MVIDHKHKYVFVCIAKTASTSIKRRLGFHDDPPPDEYHMFLKDIIHKNPETRSYFKFAFVRNPYDRLYSTYINLKHDGHSWATALKQKKTFKSFVMDFEGSRYSDYIHLQPQVDYITRDNAIGVDFLGRYENLASDFAKVEKKLNLSHVPLKKLRWSSTVWSDPKYYDEDMKKVVHRVYGEDFERFQYDK